jgi:membrane fusion protein, heavy metal efflux system
MSARFVFPLIFFLGCACAYAHADHPETEEEPFHWTKEKSEFANIQVAIAGPGVIQNFVQATGKIIAHPDYLAYVIPKVNGSVFEVRKNLGDLVEANEVLALVESKEIAEAKGEYLAALKKFNLQQTLWNREKMLQGISAGQDYLQAELAAEEAALNLQLAVQTLYALGFSENEIAKIDQEDRDALRLYAIKSPIKGRVLQRNLTLGEWIDLSAKAFTIGNFDKVWAEINVSQGDRQFLKEGLSVEVLAAPKKVATVLVTQFSPAICEGTRTATAIALIENGAHEWLPGEFVMANIQTDVTKAAIVVPLAALQFIEGEHCVFVENEQTFTPCTVQLGKMDKQNVEIVAGLTPGTAYAVCNTFCLKAEYEKEEGEHHH